MVKDKQFEKIVTNDIGEDLYELLWKMYITGSIFLGFSIFINIKLFREILFVIFTLVFGVGIVIESRKHRKVYWREVK